ncbi:hypothetical protein CDES_04830 [Corynebacterium deserti GIMN1.010]|uniref:Uncharacterized protein n=1 Tax=Corynebacterium deserti GIMN1.010 TaxID=931089 RepID=A0A0M4CHM8_9CORY|nr:hypothetical protein [Corynebacterium deserti]ALC05408.1 hypothetical protein CDES_04830 [Corynebacterium deserti GIMN1.010]
MIDLSPVITTVAGAYNETTFFLAQQQEGGPLGPEFGKASPVGLLIIVALLVAILTLGWMFHRRWSRMNRRRIFAERHGLDPFDIEGVRKAMAEAGLNEKNKKDFL